MKVDSSLIDCEGIIQSIHIRAVAHSKQQQKRILMKGNCMEQDMFEDGLTTV